MLPTQVTGITKKRAPKVTFADDYHKPSFASILLRAKYERLLFPHISSLRQHLRDLKGFRKVQLTQRHRCQANYNLYAGNAVKDGFDAGRDEPFIATPRQGKGEDILEDHHTSERFNRDVACGGQQIFLTGSKFLR